MSKLLYQLSFGLWAVFLFLGVVAMLLIAHGIYVPSPKGQPFADTIKNMEEVTTYWKHVTAYTLFVVCVGVSAFATGRMAEAVERA
jgi:hypothetical protein